MPATINATARLPQNSGESKGASIAPGMTSMIRLSTTSMIAIETVSAARARRTAYPTRMPLRSRGPIVKR